MSNTGLILEFLAELKENNNKEWIDAHRPYFEQAKDEFKNLVQDVLENMKEHDPSLAMLSVKDCIFRMNRDVRFSKDKSPYKTWMSAVMAEGGKKSLNAIYYLHLQPGNESMAAGGMYQPPGDYMRKIRQEIDYNAGELISIVKAPSFKKNFNEIEGEKLARAPKGYSPGHPNIEFLKLKSYLAIRKFPDKDLTAPEFLSEITSTFKAARPFNDFLNVAVS